MREPSGTPELSVSSAAVRGKARQPFLRSVRVLGGPARPGEPPAVLAAGTADLLDDDGLARLALSASAADAEGAEWAARPALTADDVLGAIRAERARIAGQLVSGEFSQPNQLGNGRGWVQATLTVQLGTPPKPLLVERISVTDTVRRGDLMKRARVLVSERLEPAAAAQVDWDALHAQLDAQARELVAAYRTVASRPAERGSARVRRLSEVQTRAVEWLWPGWVPYGHLTVVAGNPGVGKSWFVEALASAVSAGGRFPDGSRMAGAQGVLLCSLEDPAEEVVRPRLEGMEADMRRIWFLDGVDGPDGTRPLTLPDDVPVLAELIAAEGLRLVVVDPLVAVQSWEVDAHRQAGMRSILQPLIAMAGQTHTALILCAHLNKSQLSDPIFRINGSVDVIAAARTAIALGRDPQDARRRGASVFKSNLAAEPQPVAFTLEGGRFLWAGTDPGLSADVLFSPASSSEERGQVEECRQWLAQQLAGGAVPAAELHRQQREQQIPDSVLAAARRQLGVVSRPVAAKGKRGVRGWEWALPESRADQPDPVFTLEGDLLRDTIESNITPAVEPS